MTSRRRCQPDSGATRAEPVFPTKREGPARGRRRHAMAAEALVPPGAARVAIRIATRVATVYTNAPKRLREAILADLCTLLRPHGRSHDPREAQQCTQMTKNGAERPDPPICVHYCDPKATHNPSPRRNSVHKCPKTASRAHFRQSVYTPARARSSRGGMPPEKSRTRHPDRPRHPSYTTKTDATSTSRKSAFWTRSVPRCDPPSRKSAPCVPRSPRHRAAPCAPRSPRYRAAPCGSHATHRHPALYPVCIAMWVITPSTHPGRDTRPQLGTQTITRLDGILSRRLGPLDRITYRRAYSMARPCSGLL